jgi:hypothetical protein
LKKLKRTALPLAGFPLELGLFIYISLPFHNDFTFLVQKSTEAFVAQAGRSQTCLRWASL